MWVEFKGSFMAKLSLSLSLSLSTTFKYTWISMVTRATGLSAVCLASVMVSNTWNYPISPYCLKLYFFVTHIVSVLRCITLMSPVRLYAWIIVQFNCFIMSAFFLALSLTLWSASTKIYWAAYLDSIAIPECIVMCSVKNSLGLFS